MGRRRTAVFIDGAPIVSDCPGRGNRTRAERKIGKGRGASLQRPYRTRPRPSMDGETARDNDTSIGGM